MEASKVTVGAKTYDLNYLGKKKKTSLRRKLIVEYIQSKPAGEIIRTGEFREVCQFSTDANTHSFIKRMLRDGVIAQYDGDKPREHYYAVLGAVRVRTPRTDTPEPETPATRNPDINAFIADMQRLGVGFTITITNEAKK